MFKKVLGASWVPKLAAGLILAAAVFQGIGYTIDSDPNTNADWSKIFVEVSAALGLSFTRQNNVSSEQAGVK